MVCIVNWKKGEYCITDPGISEVILLILKRMLTFTTKKKVKILHCIFSSKPPKV